MPGFEVPTETGYKRITAAHLKTLWVFRWLLGMLGFFRNLCHRVRTALLCTGSYLWKTWAQFCLAKQCKVFPSIKLNWIKNLFNIKFGFTGKKRSHSYSAATILFSRAGKTCVHAFVIQKWPQKITNISLIPFPKSLCGICFTHLNS